MYSFPSTSQILAPAARSTKKGSPPTFRNARTGELTPPGIFFSAAANNWDEREVIVEALVPSAYLMCSALDTSAATTILGARLIRRRGSQVVRLRSAKPLFAGSIPAPALTSRPGL